MNSDPIKALEEAGIPVDQLREDQREALASLSPEEVSVLINVQKKIHANDEVVGQASPDLAVIGGVIF